MNDYTKTRASLDQAKLFAMNAAIATGRVNLSPMMSATAIRRQMLPVLEELQAATNAVQQAYDDASAARGDG